MSERAALNVVFLGSVKNSKKGWNSDHKHPHIKKMSEMLRCGNADLSHTFVCMQLEKKTYLNIHFYVTFELYKKK